MSNAITSNYTVADRLGKLAKTVQAFWVEKVDGGDSVKDACLEIVKADNSIDGMFNATAYAYESGLKAGKSGFAVAKACLYSIDPNMEGVNKIVKAVAKRVGEEENNRVLSQAIAQCQAGNLVVDKVSTSKSGNSTISLKALRTPAEVKAMQDEALLKSKLAEKDAEIARLKEKLAGK